MITDRARLLIEAALCRSRELVNLLERVREGSMEAAAALETGCRHLQCEGSVWCLQVDSILAELEIDPDEREGCDLGKGPQPAKGA